jgi:tetratricopeptide (TPR) repeat protein
MKKSAAKKTTKTAPAVSGNTWDIEDKAIKEMERGVGHLYRQNYAEALERFQSILDAYPSEMELTDRARVYVRICQAMVDRKSPALKKPEDYFYAGVLKANEADYDEAVEHLRKALEASPRDEKVHYVLASTLALKGDRQEALKHLQEAIGLNASNRIHALNDPDFEPLHEDDGFQNLIHPEET